MCVCVGGQKGVCVVWGAVALYGGAVQKSYAAEDRLRLPMHEEMRQACAQVGLLARESFIISRNTGRSLIMSACKDSPNRALALGHQEEVYDVGNGSFLWSLETISI